jgi:hypothetical protein
MKIKETFNKVLTKIGVSGIKRFAKKKSSVLKELMDDPEQFKMEAFIEDGEIIVKIKKKEL